MSAVLRASREDAALSGESFFFGKRAANPASTMRAGGFYALSNDVRARGNVPSSLWPGPIVHASNMRVPLLRAPL